jgi:hypothetical protein
VSRCRTPSALLHRVCCLKYHSPLDYRLNSKSPPPAFRTASAQRRCFYPPHGKELQLPSFSHLVSVNKLPSSPTVGSSCLPRVAHRRIPGAACPAAVAAAPSPSPSPSPSPFPFPSPSSPSLIQSPPPLPLPPSEMNETFLLQLSETLRGAAKAPPWREGFDEWNAREAPRHVGQDMTWPTAPAPDRRSPALSAYRQMTWRMMLIWKHGDPANRPSV